MRRVKAGMRGWGCGDDALKYWVYLFFIFIRRSRFLGWFRFVSVLLYSYVVSFRLFGFSAFPKVSFPEGIFTVRVRRARGSRVVHEGSGVAIVFERWRAGGDTTIVLGKRARFLVGGTFHVGDGCKVVLEREAVLDVKGRSAEQSSGITCDSIVLCSRHIEIGLGTIISWNCYISDSSQHVFEGVLKVSPVVIGDHVWISEGVTCGPGCELGNGAVVGAKSLVSKCYPDRVFLAGCPAKIIRTDISWSR